MSRNRGMALALKNSQEMMKQILEEGTPNPFPEQKFGKSIEEIFRKHMREIDKRNIQQDIIDYLDEEQGEVDYNREKLSNDIFRYYEEKFEQQNEKYLNDAPRLYEEKSDELYEDILTQFREGRYALGSEDDVFVERPPVPASKPNRVHTTRNIPVSRPKPNSINSTRGVPQPKPTQSLDKKAPDHLPDAVFPAPIPRSKPTRERALLEQNPFNLERPDLKQQAKLVEEKPLRAKQLIRAAGRDPKLFGFA